VDFGTVKIIAGYELAINSRNRWTVLFAAMFAVLALGISYFGLVTEAVIGFQGFARTSASLLNLVLYLVPIVALAMSTISYTAETEAGEILFAQPITRAEILTGKSLGLLLSIAGSTLLGFGLAGLLIAIQVGMDGLSRYLSFVGYGLLLECCFLSLGALIGIAGGTKAKSLGYSLFLWFFFVLFYDLLAMGITFILNERAANVFIFLSLFGNPVDLARVGSLVALGDPSIFGYAGAALIKFLGGRAASTLLLIVGLVLWICVPLVISARILRKRDI
jgi:Cu-processing system permease protein